MANQVLVVEDEKLVAADIQAQLEMLGYTVPRILSSGEDAIHSASELRPDLVLMDIQLKGRIDGIETAHILQSRLNIPVIYVTAFADDHTLQRAKTTEPYGYVIKPFGKKELQTAIELALHKHVREITLRSKEKWVAALVSGISAGIMAFDHDGLVCLANPYAEECTGADLTEALGCVWSDLISFLDNPPDTPQCPIRRAVLGNLPSEMSAAAVLFPKKGRRGVISAAVSPMPEPGSDRRAAILVFRDITETQRLENNFRRARHLEDMQRLAGGLAHRFANFLTMISGCSESLAGSLDPGDARLRDVRTVQKVTEQAGNLTRDLLAFSRHQPISVELLDANRCIADICETLQLTLGSSAAIQRSLDPAAGKIEVDPSHLEQVIRALVLNARDALPEGGAITIRTANMEVDRFKASRFVDLTPGSYVRIDVADCGAGMSYEQQSHAFKPFFTSKFQANGLGLAAAYGLVKQNSGYIWFESEPKKGTTASICFPRIDASDVFAGVPRFLGGNETILIADDNEGARASARSVLLPLGYRVVVAGDAAEALTICEQDPKTIDLVVARVPMLNMESRELARRLLVLRPELKLLFVSEYSGYTLQHYAALDPAAPLLQKPFTSSTFAKAIRDVLDGRRA